MPAALLGCLLALLLAAPPALTCAAPRALAVTDDVYAQADAAQQRVEETAAAYEEALARVDEVERQVAENEQRIGELEAQLPAQRERGATALSALYKLYREGFSLVEIVLSSENVVDFISRMEYIDRILDDHMEELGALDDMLAELETTKADLAAALAEAREESAAAETALAEAQEARQIAQQAALAAREEEARLAAEAEAAAAAAAAAAESSGSEAAEAPSMTPPSADNADWSSDKASFVSVWAGRIDAYLAGSPLSGQGAAFAEAAWDFGVDPRFSPAISCVESSKGAYCFRPHNAWGWGSVSWGSWGEAIRGHVGGLSRGYGYTLTVAGAQRYCPPTWEHWYGRVSEEMDKI